MKCISHRCEFIYTYTLPLEVHGVDYHRFPCQNDLLFKNHSYIIHVYVAFYVSIDPLLISVQINHTLSFVAFCLFFHSMLTRLFN